MRPSRPVTKIALPLILLLLLVLPGCSKKSSSIIEGDWTLRIVFPDMDPVERAITFEGGEDSGDVFNQQGTQLGTYSLTGLTVKFSVQVYTSQSLGYLVYVFDGAISDDAHMGGSLIGFYSNFSQAQATGTWSGTR